jgi:hypothetical protein
VGLEQDNVQPLRAGLAGKTLWRRAWGWRMAVVGASLFTVGSIALLTATDAPQVPATAAVGTQRALAQVATANNLENSPQPVRPDPLARSIDPSVVPVNTAGSTIPTETAPGANPQADEREILASCHPHLLSSPASVPQLDVANTPAPNLAHMTMHFWVNNTGVVTREGGFSGNLGNIGEREAAAGYVRQLTFLLPQTPQCKAREVELVADFGERRSGEGWDTLVRLSPRYDVARTGELREIN